MVLNGFDIASSAPSTLPASRDADARSARAPYNGPRSLSDALGRRLVDKGASRDPDDGDIVVERDGLFAHRTYRRRFNN